MSSDQPNPHPNPVLYWLPFMRSILLALLIGWALWLNATKFDDTEVAAWLISFAGIVFSEGGSKITKMLLTPKE